MIEDFLMTVWLKLDVVLLDHSTKKAEGRE